MMRPVTPPPASILPTLKPNDKVCVLLMDETKIERMKVVTLDSGSIVGSYPYWPSNKTFRIADIKGIRKLKDDKIYIVKRKSVIQVTLKNGEKIGLLKVTSVDA
jgi:hypothetical protein